MHTSLTTLLRVQRSRKEPFKSTVLKDSTPIASKNKTKKNPCIVWKHKSICCCIVVQDCLEGARARTGTPLAITAQSCISSSPPSLFASARLSFALLRSLSLLCRVGGGPVGTRAAAVSPGHRLDKEETCDLEPPPPFLSRRRCCSGIDRRLRFRWRSPLRR